MQDYPFLPLDLQSDGTSIDPSELYEQVLGSFSTEDDIQHIIDHIGEDSLEGLDQAGIHELATVDRISGFEDAMQSGDLETAQDLVEGANASVLDSFWDSYGFNDFRHDL
jgi:hypothetical protein